LATIALIFVFSSESSTQAGFLKNGVRPSSDRLDTVKVPRKGARKRIYAPGERAIRSQPAAPRGGSRKQQHAWFWKTHSVSVSAATGARWGQAIETMANRRAVGKRIVGTGTLQTILASHRNQIRQAAARHRVSDALILAVIAVESRGQSGAVSPKGARGLMQLMPATGKRFGVTNAFDTGQNINGGTAYLSWLLKEFNGDPLLALAGYNAGEGAVRKHKGVPPFRETRDYVVKVMDAIAAARTLCSTPPATPRAPCTWRLAGG
jgi:soluble lytic murein transglycosylase-like protein